MDNKAFREIVDFYLLKCPVRVYTRVKKNKDERDSTNDQKHPKYDYYFTKVSKQGVTFEDRGLDGARLNSFRAAMKKVAETDIVLQSVDSIEQLKTENEYLVTKRNEGKVSVTEGYFYCIRNALAHGRFYIDDNKTYWFENYCGTSLRGVGKVREETLLAWIKLFNLDYESIKTIGK